MTKAQDICLKAYLVIIFPYKNWLNIFNNDLKLSELTLGKSSWQTLPVTLNLPEWPWFKIKTHHEVVCNLCVKEIKSRARLHSQTIGRTDRWADWQSWLTVGWTAEIIDSYLLSKHYFQGYQYMNNHKIYN